MDTENETAEGSNANTDDNLENTSQTQSSTNATVTKTVTNNDTVTMTRAELQRQLDAKAAETRKALARKQSATTTTTTEQSTNNNQSDDRLTALMDRIEQLGKLVEDGQQKLKEKEVAEIRTKVGNRFKLPAAIVARLVGNTETEIVSDAEEIAKSLGLVPKATVKAADTHAGAGNRATTTTSATNAASVVQLPGYAAWPDGGQPINATSQFNG